MLDITMVETLLRIRRELHKAIDTAVMKAVDQLDTSKGICCYNNDKWDIVALFLEEAKARYPRSSKV